MGKKVCVIIGFGPGLGTAYAEIFKDAGYDLGLLSRSGATLDGAEPTDTLVRAYKCDAGDPDSLKSALAAAQSDLGEIADTGHSRNPLPLAGPIACIWRVKSALRIGPE